MKILGAILMLLGIGVFYVAFFMVAPAVASLLPANEWSSVLTAIVYAAIAYVGGIGFPLFLLIAGLWLLCD